jgi:hypothetical protein
VSAKSWEPELQAGEGDHGLVVDGSLVVTGGEGSVLFESAEAAFDDVAASVGDGVEAAEPFAASEAAVDLVDAFGNRAGDPSFAQVGADFPGRVSLVGGHSIRTGPGSARARPGHADPFHDGFELGAVVGVASGQGEGQGATLSVAGQVDLGGQSAA